jgi:WD40 repeat protein
MPKSYATYDIKPSYPEHKHIEAHSSKEGTCLRFNPQGTLLGTGGGDGTVKIWDVSDGGSGECVDTIR